MNKKRKNHATGALGALMASGQISTIADKPTASAPTEADAADKILEINPNEAHNWAFHDRPESELGDIDSLAKEFQSIGQQCPCIARKSAITPGQYEIIAGERRWRAAQLAGTKLKVIVNNLTDDQAALVQAAENMHREDLSDYAKGISFGRLIRKGIITTKDIEANLGISKSQVSRLLAFNDLPEELMDAIGDMSLVSARTAETIRSYLNKSERFLEVLIALAPKIGSKHFGHHQLTTAIEKLMRDKPSNTGLSTYEVKDSTGRHLFTWRTDSNRNISISFPKNIRNFIENRREDVETNITQLIENIIKTTDNV